MVVSCTIAGSLITLSVICRLKSCTSCLIVPCFNWHRSYGSRFMRVHAYLHFVHECSISACEQCSSACACMHTRVFCECLQVFVKLLVIHLIHSHGIDFRLKPFLMLDSYTKIVSPKPWLSLVSCIKLESWSTEITGVDMTATCTCEHTWAGSLGGIVSGIGQPWMPSLSQLMGCRSDRSRPQEMQLAGFCDPSTGY